MYDFSESTSLENGIKAVDVPLPEASKWALTNGAVLRRLPIAWMEWKVSGSRSSTTQQ